MSLAPVRQYGTRHCTFMRWSFRVAAGGRPPSLFCLRIRRGPIQRRPESCGVVLQSEAEMRVIASAVFMFGHAAGLRR